MAAQVTTVHPRQKESLVDAMARALQGYQAFQQAGEASARTDLINAQKDQLEAPEDTALSTDKQAEFIKAGGKVSAAPTDTSSPLLAHVRAQNPDTGETEDTVQTLHFSPPEKAGISTPKEVSYRNSQGQNVIGFQNGQKVYDTHGNEVENPLAASQPKDLTAGQESAASKIADKHFQTTQSLLEGMRGNPAVQQAEKDIYAAGKVNSLIDKLGGGDPNNLNPQAVQLLVGEVGKIAQGGSPTVGELDALSPNTLSTKLAGVTQRLLGEPTPANAGEFLKQYKDYADGLTVDAQKQITDRYGRILDSNKNKLSSEDYDTLKANYVDRFKGAAEAAGQKLGDLKKKGSGGSFGTANAGSSPQDHPEADQATQWAKAHPNDPRSATILNALRK